MSENITIKRLSLMERIRQITSAAILAGGLLIGGAAHATTSRPSSVVDRAVAVQDALKEKLRADSKTDNSATANAAQPSSRAQLLLAEWINWTNWNNWANWNNWRNWRNWANAWSNWVNY